MRFGWLIKITSLRLAVGMAPFQKALLTDSDEDRLLKDERMFHLGPAVNAAAAALRSLYDLCQP